MEVRLVRGPAARVIPGVGRVERGGKAVKVSDEQGRRLLKGGLYEQVRSAPKPSTKTTTKTVEPTTKPTETKE